MERENDNYEAMEKTIGETIENIIGKKTVKNKLQHLRNLENLFTPKTSGEQTEGASLIQRWQDYRHKTGTGGVLYKAQRYLRGAIKEEEKVWVKKSLEEIPQNRDKNHIWKSGNLAWKKKA